MSFKGSLARRVFFICLVLIVLPLILHSLYLWDRDRKAATFRAVSELEIFSESIRSGMEFWEKYRLTQLRELSLIYENPKLVTTRYTDVQSVFVFDRSFTCIGASIPAMVGAKAFFPASLRQGFANGKSFFTDINPFSKQTEVFVMRKEGNLLWGLSVSAERFLNHFYSKAGDSRQFSVELMKKNGDILALIGSKDSVKHTKLTLDQLSQLRQEAAEGASIAMEGGLSVIIPFSDANFSIVTNVTSEGIATLEGKSLLTHLLYMLIFLITVGTILALIFVWRAARPMKKLASVMDNFGKPSFDLRYQKDSFGFEINALGEHFNQMAQNLVNNMEAVASERVARQLLEKELQIGHQVQLTLLPKKLPEFPGLAISSGFYPAKEVAGDYYDLFALPDEKLLIVVADGSDKGISACLYSLITRSMMRTSISEEKTFSEAVSLVNQLFCLDTGDSGNFVTAWIGLFDASDGSLTYTNAGHTPALYLSPTEGIKELTTKGIALGVSPISEITCNKTAFSQGDTLLLYTDGVTEAQNKEGKLFGKSRLQDVVSKLSGDSPHQFVDQILAELEQFSEGEPLHDDITVLCLQSVSH